MMETESMPLGSCAQGESVRVESLGTDSAFAGRLRAMGIQDGVELDIVRTGSTMIVRLNHVSRLCLRGDDVAQIWVSSAPSVAADLMAWTPADMATEGFDARH